MCDCDKRIGLPHKDTRMNIWENRDLCKHKIQNKLTPVKKYKSIQKTTQF